jgi:hypothetical protein
MITSQEYRRMAEECFGWAREAQTDEVRLCYVNLAATWLQAASWMEDVSDRCSQVALTRQARLCFMLLWLVCCLG